MPKHVSYIKDNGDRFNGIECPGCLVKQRTVVSWNTRAPVLTSAIRAAFEGGQFSSSCRKCGTSHMAGITFEDYLAELDAKEQSK